MEILRGRHTPFPHLSAIIFIYVYINILYMYMLLGAGSKVLLGKTLFPQKWLAWSLVNPVTVYLKWYGNLVITNS